MTGFFYVKARNALYDFNQLPQIAGFIIVRLHIFTAGQHSPN
jgi:hypothetical protein